MNSAKISTQTVHNYSVGKDIAHWNPDVLTLDGVIQKLLPLPLFGIGPVSFDPVIHPGSLHVLC